MSRKKKEIRFPYELFDGYELDFFALDWCLVTLAEPEGIRGALMNDLKYKRTLQEHLEEMDEVGDPSDAFLHKIAAELGEHYNVFNELVGQVLLTGANRYSKAVRELELLATVDEQVAWVYASAAEDYALAELITCIRFSKNPARGQLLQAILQDERRQAFLDGKADGQEASLYEDYSLADLRQGIDAMLDSMQNKLFDAELREIHINAMDELLGEQKLRIEELEQQVVDKKELEKQLKSKDTHIKKQAQALSKAEKTAKTLQDKMDNLQKNIGQKSQDIGELRKQLETQEKDRDQLHRQVQSLQHEQDKVKDKIERELSQKHQQELAKVKAQLHDKIDTLEADNAYLSNQTKVEVPDTSGLELQLHNLEKYRTELEKKVDKLVRENDMLTADNHALNKQLLEAKKEPLQVPVTSQPSMEEGIVDVDTQLYEEIFGELDSVPTTDVRDNSHQGVIAAAVPAGREEDELQDLFFQDNKPTF